MIAFELNKLIQQYGSVENAALALIEQIGTSYFYLGGLLVRLHQDNAHSAGGYPESKRGFSAYVLELFDLKTSTSDLLMRIYRVLGEAGIGAEELHKTNYTGMRLIVMLPPNVLREEKSHWLDLARTLSATKLDAKVREKLSTLNLGRKAGRPAKRSNRCGGIQHGRHVSRDDYRKLLTEKEDLALENERLRAALDTPEGRSEVTFDNEISRLNQKIMELYKENDALADQYEKQRRETATLEAHLPVTLSQETDDYLILNFNSDQRQLSNRCIAHARKLGREKVKNDIDAYWYVLQLYYSLLIEPKNTIQKEQSLKRLAGFLTQKGMSTSTKPQDERNESEYGILDIMIEDIGRGIDVGSGQAWYKAKGCQ